MRRGRSADPAVTLSSLMFVRRLRSCTTLHETMSHVQCRCLPIGMDYGRWIYDGRIRSLLRTLVQRRTWSTRELHRYLLLVTLECRSMLSVFLLHSSCAGNSLLVELYHHMLSSMSVRIHRRGDGTSSQHKGKKQIQNSCLWTIALEG